MPPQSAALPMADEVLGYPGSSLFLEWGALCPDSCSLGDVSRLEAEIYFNCAHGFAAPPIFSFSFQQYLLLTFETFCYRCKVNNRMEGLELPPLACLETQRSYE